MHDDKIQKGEDNMYTFLIVEKTFVVLLNEQYMYCLSLVPYLYAFYANNN